MKRKKATMPSTKQQTQFSLGLLAAYALFSAVSMAFVKLAWEVREQETLPVEDSILNTIHQSFSTHFLDAFMPIATDIGGIVGVILLTVVIVTLLSYKNEYRRALLIVVSVAGAALLNVLLKAVFARPRPDMWTQLIQEVGYSFPSGHAMASAALGFALVVALWHSRWRWWAAGFAGVYIVFVGFSRLYLGVHYPTDIIAGWLVSGAWVLAVALTMRSKFGHRALKNLS